MSNYGDTPDETPQDPHGQQPPPGPPGEPDYGQPAGQSPYGQPYGQPAGQSPYGQTPAGGAPFSVGNAFGYGWNTFKANLGPILIAVVVLLAVLFAIQIVQFVVTGGSDASFEIDPNTGQLESSDSGLLGASIIASLFFGGLSFLAQLVIQSGIVKGALDLTKGKPISLGSMFSGINWVQVIVASLIIAVAMMIGFVLCILPGIAVMFFTAFTLFFIIDKDMPAIAAIKASVSFTLANAGTLIVFFLACFAAYLVGALLCGVGLLVAIPVVVLAQAYAFRTLHGEQVAAA
jgi:uncharacterized membrane protein